MSKSIRFLGGPADQELRSIPDKATRVMFAESAAVDFSDGVLSVDPSSEVEVVWHEYLEAFPGASYFKYQGIAGSESEHAPEPAFLGMVWFTK